MKKTLLTCLNIVLAILVVTAGTLTYLKAENSAKDGETIEIDQVMWQRDEQGDLKEILANEGVDESFFFPMVTDVTDIQYKKVEIYGKEYSFLPDTNAVDKIVTVTNKGTAGAYVRTVFAFEADALEENDSKIILQKNEDDWSWTSVGEFEIDGSNYDVWVAVYNDVLVGGGTTTPPSLLQVGMKREATSSYAAQFGHEYEIRAYSQAIQSRDSNFDIDVAKSMLNSIFGNISANEHPWLPKTGTQ